MPGAAHAATIENSPVLLKKPSPIRTYLCHLRSTPLWGPGAVPGEWADVCGFIKPPDSHDKWQVRLHGAFSILHSALGLKERDQCCHREVWMHLSHANPRGDRGVQYKHTQRLHLKRKEPHCVTTAHRKMQGSTGTKRPFAQLIGHPYDQYVLP